MQIFKKKDQGLIEHYLPMVLTLIFFGILMMACASWSSWVDKSNELNQVCRKYMLRMEGNKGFAFAYVWNKSDEQSSEFGTIAIESFGGGIKRIG